MRGRKRIPKDYFRCKDNQHRYLDYLYVKLNCVNLDSFLQFSKVQLCKYGAQSLLSQYSNNIPHLLTSIYPNYPWEFEDAKVYSNIYFKSLENQRKFMDKFYIENEIKTLDEFSSISSQKIIQKGGQSLLYTYYSKDKKKLFSTIYPNFPFEFEKKITKEKNFQNYSIEYFSSISNQREFMENLRNKLKLKTINELMFITTNLIIKYGGYVLILHYYSNDIMKLLSSIYPEYNWNFNINNNNNINNIIYNNFNNNNINNNKENNNNNFNNNFNNNINNNNNNNIDNININNNNKENNNNINNINNINNNINNVNNLKRNYTLKYFSKIENQQKFIEQFIKILNLNSLTDLDNYILNNNNKNDILNDNKNKLKNLINNNKNKLLNLNKIKENDIENSLKLIKIRIKKLGGKKLLNIYLNDISKLLLTIYPNYSWEFINYKFLNNFFKSSIDNQKLFMDKLFNQFGLKSLDDWVDIPRNKIIKNGGKYLINYIYLNDKMKLLSTIYPNFPFEFDDQINKKNYFAIIQKQRKRMDKIYTKFQLKSLDDWLYFSKKKFKLNGGHNLLANYYENDMKKLLSSIYPNHLWQFDKLKIISKKRYFKSIENQKNFMDNLFYLFKLNSLADWLTISRFRIKQQNGGSCLLIFYYANDRKKLLSTIYPNFPWKKEFENFQYKRKNSNYFKSIENQRLFMDKLFIKFELKSLDDWAEISLKKMIENNGENFVNIYNNNRKKLFSSIYPNFPWSFENLKLKLKIYFFRLLKNQKNYLEKLFYKFKLNSLEEWVKKKKKKLIKHGKILLNNYYNNNINELLINIYPNFPWDFEQLNSMKNQRKIMENISKKLNFKSNSDFLNLSKYQFSLNGGYELLRFYSNNYLKLLSSIYPTIFTFISPSSNLNENLNENSKENSNLNSNENFNSFSSSSSLLSFNLSPLTQLKYGNKKYYLTSIEYNKYKLIKLKEKFLVYKKKDWYRLPSISSSLLSSSSSLLSSLSHQKLYKTLKLIYPNEKWEKKLFKLNSKKTKQRLLFALLVKFYFNFNIFESYRHPKLTSLSQEYPLEFDIYIPSLNLAIEYQGEQHYNDSPVRFPYYELYHSRDSLKECLSLNYSIKLICVPYWWDLSEDSFYSTLQKINFFNSIK